jgi:hypothetical protein
MMGDLFHVLSLGYVVDLKRYVETKVKEVGISDEQE